MKVNNTGVPRCVRMDRGTENTLIEDIQQSFRSQHTDDMAAHSVLYGSSTHNQVILYCYACISFNDSSVVVAKNCCEIL